MIYRLELDGFKSFVFDSLELGSLTLLTGLNSCGKSSIIQALLMLEKAARQKEYLLEGHGDIHELRNPYCQSVAIIAETDIGNNFTLSSSPTTHDQNRQFPKLIYISADRFGPELSIPIFVGNNFNLGSKGENVFKCIEKNENELIPEQVKHSSSKGDTFAYNIEGWLKVISPHVEFSYSLQKLNDTSVATFNGFRAKNVGFGLSYTLPVIVALLLATITPNCIVMIENPEAHLHPRGQTEIGKLIALVTEAAKAINTQLIIETHSDHLFDAIRIHAKNSETNFDEIIKIHWLELNKKLNTEITEIQIDKDGRMHNCPQGFFDQFEINARKLL